jgi:hypothetical protein
MDGSLNSCWKAYLAFVAKLKALRGLVFRSDDLDSLEDLPRIFTTIIGSTLRHLSIQTLCRDLDGPTWEGSMCEVLPSFSGLGSLKMSSPDPEIGEHMCPDCNLYEWGVGA